MSFSVLALISLLSIHAPFSVHIHLFLLYIIFCLSLNLPSIHLFLLGTIFCPYSSDLYPSLPPLYHFLSSFIHLPFIHLFLFCVIFCQYSSPSVPSLPSLYHFFVSQPSSVFCLPPPSLCLLFIISSLYRLYSSLLCMFVPCTIFCLSLPLSFISVSSISVSFLSQLHLISSFSVRFSFSAILSLLSICSFSAPFLSQTSSPFRPSVPSLHHFCLGHPLPSVLLFLLCTIFCHNFPHPPIHLFFLCAVLCYIIFPLPSTHLLIPSMYHYLSPFICVFLHDNLRSSTHLLIQSLYCFLSLFICVSPYDSLPFLLLLSQVHYFFHN